MVSWGTWKPLYILVHWHNYFQHLCTEQNVNTTLLFLLSFFMSWKMLIEQYDYCTLKCAVLSWRKKNIFKHLVINFTIFHSLMLIQNIPFGKLWCFQLYWRWLVEKLSGHSHNSVGESFSQHADCMLPQNLQHLWCFRVAFLCVQSKLFI